MNAWEIQKRIDIVLAEENRAYAANDRRRGGLGSLNITLQSVPNYGWTAEGQIPTLLFDQSDRNVIGSPNAAILLKLYSALDVDGKRAFRSYLISNLRRDSAYAEIAYFIFFVLYRIGAATDALSMARSALAGDTHFGYSNLLGVLSMVVSREYLEIDPKTYESIKLILLNDKEHDFQLREKINLALLKHLEVELSDVNPEVNVDRDKIVELWGRKFANPEVPALIREIEDYFREGDFSQTKFATCIGRIRVLLVEVAKKIATGLAQRDGDTSVSEESGEAHLFQCLRNKGFISDPEWNILRSLYALASASGAHSPISNREYARLVKNMSYELLLLFLGKWDL